VFLFNGNFFSKLVPFSVFSEWDIEALQCTSVFSRHLWEQQSFTISEAANR